MIAARSGIVVRRDAKSLTKGLTMDAGQQQMVIDSSS
jgi:hypothetical protein